MNNQPKYTLITGAGGGLGRELAIQCASQKMNLILISLPGSGIRSLAERLMQLHAVDIAVYEFDLTDDAAFYDRLQYISAQYEIDFLINNAGMGGTAHILDCPIETIDCIIKLNIRSTALLTRYLLPNLIRQKESYILNVASLAARSPIAYKTVYPASKAFLSSFSFGLREELQDKGVSVTVAYPGPMMTNYDTSRRIVAQGVKGRISTLSTAAIAATLIRQTLAGKPAIAPGFWNRVSMKLMQLLPTGFKTHVVSAQIKSELQLAYS